MKLRDGQCRKCLSMGYCYFPKDCGRQDDPADALVSESERLDLYDDDPFMSDSYLRYNNLT